MRQQLQKLADLSLKGILLLLSLSGHGGSFKKSVTVDVFGYVAGAIQRLTTRRWRAAG
jgi:hypothetical protein